MRGLREGKQGDWRRPCTNLGEYQSYIGLAESELQDQTTFSGEPSIQLKLKDVGVKRINHLRAYMSGKLTEG